MKKRTQLNVRLPADALAALDALCRSQGVTRTAAVDRLVRGAPDERLAIAVAEQRTAEARRDARHEVRLATEIRERERSARARYRQDMQFQRDAVRVEVMKLRLRIAEAAAQRERDDREGLPQ